MARVHVSIGSNIDPAANVRSCLDCLEREFGTLTVSSTYRSAPVGFEGDDFYNLVVGFDTDLEPRALVARLKAIEDSHGRRRAGRPRFSARTLDLDLLLYDNLILRDGDLELPSDEITRYAFVLQPLAEIAGRHRHPLLGQTYAALWRAFDAEQQPLRAVG
jgi:2-amino-4-hydroxy-6-hydroxymethyldihydropteridine diphosphokinase